MFYIFYYQLCRFSITCVNVLAVGLVSIEMVPYAHKTGSKSVCVYVCLW